MPNTTDDLIRFVDRWKQRKIVVVGDFMLDRYVYGYAQRLSPDAPVPVLAAQRSQHSAGGAANVCLDLSALRCRVACLGVVGKDQTANRLKESLSQAGCDTSGLIASGDRPTTVKHNFVGLAQHRHPQKMFRVDEESRDPLPAQVIDRLLTRARVLLRGASVLCIEDYQKGVVTESLCQGLIRLAKARGIPVLVDPAAIDDYAKYRGATCITPNRTEASLVTGMDTNGEHADQREQKIRKMARWLLRKLRLSVVVLTLDKQGALLLEKGKPPRRVPTLARSVYDVSGAGDMVLAMLAASIANGADWPAAVELANIAAGLEVEKFGTVPIELDQILLSLLRRQHQDLGKVRMLDQLLPELAAYRSQGKNIAFTNGCFDILHAGHISYLRAARSAGDLLVVGLNSDRSIRRIKGQGRPVNKETDRLMVLSELESVDYVVLFDQETPITLIQTIRPDVLVKGADYRRDQVVGGDLVESYGGQVKLVKLVRGRSTTNIIRKLQT